MSQLQPKYCFIDAQNFDSFFFKQANITNLNRFIDYKKLYDYLVQNIKVKPGKVFIFVGENRSYRQVDLFKKFGFQVMLCRAKRENKDGTESHNIDTDLVIKSLTEYYEIEDHDLVLLTGDGDFIPLIDFYEERNAKVELICPSRSKILDCKSPTSSKLLTKNSRTGEQRSVNYLDEIGLYVKKCAKLNHFHILETHSPSSFS